MFLTAFQWSVLSFFLVQGVAIIKFSVWLVTSINKLDIDSKENCKRASDIKNDIDALKNDDRRNEKDISRRLDLISQGLVRVETNVANIKEQLK